MKQVHFSGLSSHQCHYIQRQLCIPLSIIHRQNILSDILSTVQDQECRACTIAFPVGRGPWAVHRSPVHAGMAPRRWRRRRVSVGGEPGRPWQLQQATCLTPHCKETIFPIKLASTLPLFRLLCSPLSRLGRIVDLLFCAATNHSMAWHQWPCTLISHGPVTDSRRRGRASTARRHLLIPRGASPAKNSLRLRYIRIGHLPRLLLDVATYVA